MSTIIKVGGKQYTVNTGDIVTVEKMDKEIGAKVSLPAVMTFDNGKVNTKEGKCEVTVVEHGKGDKINIFKYKPKNNVRKKQGHRQPYTKIKVGDVK
jgi:large subunit ribosomal protein L21